MVPTTNSGALQGYITNADPGDSVSPCLGALSAISDDIRKGVVDAFGGALFATGVVILAPVEGPVFLGGLAVMGTWQLVKNWNNMTPDEKIQAGTAMAAGRYFGAATAKSFATPGEAGGTGPGSSEPIGGNPGGSNPSGEAPFGGGPTGGEPPGGGPSGGGPPGGNPGGRPEANPVEFQKYKDQLRREMGKPNTSGTDPTVENVMTNMYRPDAKVGSGSTADILRAEIRTGKPVSPGGELHDQKAANTITNIAKWLRNNPAPPQTGDRIVPNAPASADRAAMENVMQDLINAQKGK